MLHLSDLTLSHSHRHILTMVSLQAYAGLRELPIKDELDSKHWHRLLLKQSTCRGPHAHHSMDHEHVHIPHADITGTTVITEVRWAHHDKCDSITLDGKMKPCLKEWGTYSHAQKMRAAMTYVFGRLHGLGDMPWHQSEVTNKMLGNPSVSTQVSSYMCMLHCYKVCPLLCFKYNLDVCPP